MLDITYGSYNQSRARVLSQVSEWKKNNKDFRVIDVGGVAGNSWTRDIADMVVDINAVDSERSLKLDICKPKEWDRLLDMVSLSGPYDYAICTHTLEDIYNPFTALEYLPRIAHAGIITMPSIRTELSRIESRQWVGYIHHRWLFDLVDQEMLIIPKINILECLAGDRFFQDRETEEICYEWRGNIPYRCFMNNYLGPNVQTVIDEYKRLIDNISC